MGEHIWTEGEKANMKAYWDSKPKPRKNLMKLDKTVLSGQNFIVKDIGVAD